MVIRNEYMNGRERHGKKKKKRTDQAWKARGLRWNKFSYVGQTRLELVSRRLKGKRDAWWGGCDRMSECSL